MHCNSYQVAPAWQNLQPVLIWDIASTKLPSPAKETAELSSHCGAKQRVLNTKGSKPSIGGNQHSLVALVLSSVLKSSQVATKHRFLCSSLQVDTKVAKHGLQHNPSQDPPEPTHPVATFRPYENISNKLQKLHTRREELADNTHFVGPNLAH